MSALEEMVENNATVERIVSRADARCDSGAALRELLDLLVDADLHEEADESTDAALDKISRAKTILFSIATRRAAALVRGSG